MSRATNFDEFNLTSLLAAVPAAKDIGRQNELLVGFTELGLSISGHLVDADGITLIQIENNRPAIEGRKRSWDLNFASNAVEVVNASSNVVVQLVLSEGALEIRGKFYSTNGAWIGISGKQAGNLEFGTFNLILPQISPGFCIQPLFRYPSAQHSGEFSK